MKWIKKDRIFNVSGNFGWMNSHAQVPTVLAKNDILRIYFATRPEPGLSMTTFLDVDINNPHEVLYIHDKPILELGIPGAFDEHGVMPSYVCENSGQVWMYYAGWSRRESIRYSNWTGIAVSNDGGKTFERMFPGPILDRTPHEIFSATGCYILREEGNWHMWYASGVEWLKIDDQYEEHYVIKHAESKDGVNWIRENKKLLPSKAQYEPTHTPTVLSKDGKYHMWFCYRSVENFRDGKGSYRMGYAWSNDLRDWKREDEKAGIDVSNDGWDSKMTAYPYIVETPNNILMFYNGNGFGSSGIGYAYLES
jgi:sucrose-6-phosphate hydrolase SacC (GH32 family)